MVRNKYPGDIIFITMLYKAIILFFICFTINAQSVLSLRNTYGFSGTGVISLDNPFGFIPPANNITIPTDSLKLYIEFFKDRGLGKSTYAQLMPSLYVNGTRNGDTLQLGSASTPGTDDPADSTAFGYIYFDGSNDYCVTTKNYYLSNTFTWVIKFSGFGNGLVIYAGSGIYSYTTTGFSFKTTGLTGGGNLDYYANWGLNRLDTITAYTSEMKLFANGIERGNTAVTITGTLGINPMIFGLIPPATLPFKGRIYSIALYNKILTPAEIQQWNN